VSHKMAEDLYQQTGATGGDEPAADQSASAGAASSSSGGEDNVIDAEYVDVDDDKK